MLKKCPACNKKREMKSNQKYCNDKCKKTFENTKYSGPKGKPTKGPRTTPKPPLAPPSLGGIIRPTELNEVAAAYWDKLAPTMIERGHLNVLSEDAFAELCDLKSRLWDTNKAINEGNRSLLQIDDAWDNKKGTESQKFAESALSKNKRMYSRLFLDYQKQFYLIPASVRGNFGLEDKDDVDPLDAFIRGKGE